MDFANQKKAYLLRHVSRLSWEKIAEQVSNVSGEPPSWVCVKETVKGFNVRQGPKLEKILLPSRSNLL